MDTNFNETTESKRHYHPHIIQFDILNDPRWQANIEAKQGPFQLDRYRPFAFEHGNMVVVIV